MRLPIMSSCMPPQLHMKTKKKISLIKNLHFCKFYEQFKDQLKQKLKFLIHSILLLTFLSVIKRDYSGNSQSHWDSEDRTDCLFCQVLVCSHPSAISWDAQGTKPEDLHQECGCAETAVQKGGEPVTRHTKGNAGSDVPFCSHCQTQAELLNCHNRVL